MLVNWDNYDMPDEYSPVPEGTYEVAITEIEQTQSKAGNEMWNLTLEIQGGPFAGRKLFDRLVFAEKAMPRVKLVCSRLGVATVGEGELSPEMLEGKTATVNVTIDKYESDNGPRQTNVIPFDGYLKPDVTGEQRIPGIKERAQGNPWDRDKPKSTDGLPF